MRILPTMLCTIFSCFSCIQSHAANHYKVQIGAFVKKIPFTHFAFSGVNDIYMNTDKNNIHHYYLRTTFEKYLIANRVKDSLVLRGFSNAVVIPVKEANDPIIKAPLKESKSLSPTLSKEKIFYSKTIYYHSNQYNLTRQSKTELDELLKQLKKHPHLKIAVIGHTDSRGKAAYNVELSKNRVRIIKRYLKKNGISKERITAMACGEASPVVDNTCELGLDLPENRKWNRRVVIVSTTEKGEIVRQASGQTVHPVLEREDLKD